jgi:hypothetical protein
MKRVTEKGHRKFIVQWGLPVIFALDSELLISNKISKFFISEFLIAELVAELVAELIVAELRALAVLWVQGASTAGRMADAVRT